MADRLASSPDGWLAGWLASSCHRTRVLRARARVRVTTNERFRDA
jgi:hypothetical protein